MDAEPYGSDHHERDGFCAVSYHRIFYWGSVLAFSAWLVHRYGDVAHFGEAEFTMLIVFALITGILVGILPGLLKVDRIRSTSNVIVGIVGALAGAFLGFGDAAIFLTYPFLSERTLMIAVSILFVSVKVLATRNRAAR
jgi:uncharacterized membrane protein YeaQ/YmgE (transglycosylase-associated protein family)